ncbi:MAG: sugar epimerase [Gammaproteobacteria bacterium CG_4_10_14_0_8_um_filter_38_16]|nr:MAG: sugar epimerase [Gammaproteobacteria bacterium CG_4_10_14_0_8_um_filter_38_16]PJA03268.1 MAG: sugar epimerase [Gammaproteobacteria bacterium CG_4_10_14_0_2_um_filter_38_22]PJB09830.1 MAG: sugar epimerase [Gammaproteobacteria bacterium CG_4_9_14_3_um_filter_38_9]
MNSLLLTGGNGFLGKHIRESFLDRYNIFSPSRQELELTDSDAVNNYFCDHAIDCVLHTATVGAARNLIKSESEYLLENLKSFVNIFQNSKHVKRFIQFGSGAEYGKPFVRGAVCEEEAGINLPRDAYGLSKFFSGQLLERQESKKFVNLRIFGVFGAYEDYKTRFISNVIMRSLLGLPIIVNQNAIFDYIYIHDFLKILDYFIQSPTTEVSYNITAGDPITLVALAEIVHELTHNPYELVVKHANINENYTGNNARLLHFLPADFKFTPIKEAISDHILWCERYIATENKDLIFKNILSF